MHDTTSLGTHHVPKSQEVEAREHHICLLTTIRCEKAGSRLCMHNMLESNRGDTMAARHEGLGLPE
jgi:hypothetical protein